MRPPGGEAPEAVSKQAKCTKEQFSRTIEGVTEVSTPPEPSPILGREKERSFETFILSVAVVGRLEEIQS